MKPVYQTRFGGSDAPEAEQGDCMAACLASIFEVTLDDVPDFTGTINGGDWFFELQKWLKAKNLSLLMLPAKPLDVPAGYAMAAVLSKTLAKPEDGHMIVVKNGLPIHDPNPRVTKNQLDEYTITEYWAFTVMDPSKLRGAQP